MKIKYEIDLDNDESPQFRKYIHEKAEDMGFFIWELLTNTRRNIEREWDANGAPEELYNSLDIVFKKIYDLVEEYDINIDKLS